MKCCCKYTAIIAVIIAAWVGYKIQVFLYTSPPVPEVALDQWWGPGSPDLKEDKSIKPFKIEFKPEVIADLKQRLSRSNYAPPLEGVGFQYGFNTDYLKEVLEFWKNKYDFAEREKYLNSYPQFKTKIQGLDMHFLHVKPKTNKNTRVIPLLMLHGWPGSVVEFYKIIPLLTTERKGENFVFEVIIPSLPGYGFSQGASKRGMGSIQVAVIMKNLMNRLGFQKYMIQGGDWGAIITSHMATLFPEEIYGYNSNMPYIENELVILRYLIGSIYPPMNVKSKADEKLYPVIQHLETALEESGYLHLQATKPDTLGIGLSDSPAGLAGYILEKFSTATNMEWRARKDGGVTKKFTLTELLDNIMVYYVSNSITTSIRLYAESINKAQLGHRMDSIHVHVPMTLTRCEHEVLVSTEWQLSSKYKNILQVNNHDDCGHFAAFEKPQFLADDLWSSVPVFDKYISSTDKKEL